MSPTLWSGAAAVPGVLQFGRAQLWFGCILYFYCWILTLMALVSKEWRCSLGVISNTSCPQCPSWEHQHGKDQYQLALLTVATVLGAVGYAALALRWLPMFARFPVLKMLSVLLLAAVIVLDFEAHFSYYSTYSGFTASSATSDTLFFCTAYSYALIAAVYGCLTVGLLAWHEGVEWSVRRRMREKREQRRVLREQRQVEGEKPQIVLEQPGVAGDRQAAVTAPASDSSAAASSLSPVPPPASLPASHAIGAMPAFSSAYLSSTYLPASSAALSSTSTPSSVAGWCERLGLYTRADAKVDSLLLKWTWKDQLSPMQRRLVLGVNAFFLLLYFGGLIISSIEGWALQDGVNYILSSWCTLGYGLYTPITTGGRLFMYAYWPVGFIIISSTSTTIWRVILARADRILKVASEKLIAHEPHRRTASTRAATQRSEGRLTEERQSEKEAGAPRARNEVECDEEDEEQRSGPRHQSAYPSLKDIVFSSPSNKELPSHPTAPAHLPPAHVTEQHRTPTAAERTAAPVSNNGRSAAVEVVSPTSSNLSAQHTSHARGGAMRLSPRPSQHAKRPQPDLSRFSTLPNGASSTASQYVPSARFPLNAGRGHFSLTVYEAADKPSLPSLADVFAPLHSASAADEAERATLPQPQSTAVTPSKSSQRTLPTLARPPSVLPRSRTPTAASAAGAAVARKKVSDSQLTLVSSSLRNDFLAHLKRQTNHEQLQRDIRQQRNSIVQPERQSVAHRLSALPEESTSAPAPPSSPHSSVSSQPSPLAASNPPLATSRSFAPGAHQPPVSPTLPHGRSVSTTRASPLLRELVPLLVKLGIAVLAVICWICLAGGVLVWTEGGRYDYWNCQWSAFNLLTTISVGSIATPFSTHTSAFFVWYLLLGVGTLAYCFALLAQLAFIAFDKREAAHHQHARDVAQWKTGGAASPDAASSATRKRESSNGEDGFVAHAKELDSLILQLVQRQADTIESEQDVEKQHQAFVRSPVLMLGGGGAAGEQVEVPLEGVSLLLRYHLAFQAFEKERARIHSVRMAKAARKARQRTLRRTPQQSIGKLDVEAAGAAADSGKEAETAQAGQQAEGTAGSVGLEMAGDGQSEDGEQDESEEEEEKLADYGQSDRWFDWSNDKDWIAQAEEESVSLATEPPVEQP